MLGKIFQLTTSFFSQMVKKQAPSRFGWNYVCKVLEIAGMLRGLRKNGTMWSCSYRFLTCLPYVEEIGYQAWECCWCSLVLAAVVRAWCFLSLIAQQLLRNEIGSSHRWFVPITTTTTTHTTATPTTTTTTQGPQQPRPQPWWYFLTTSKHQKIHNMHWSLKKSAKD